jgi:hypothetical protein
LCIESLVTITLKNVAYRTDLLTGLIANGNLVLDTSPTLIITGSGGKNTAANTIAFNFSACTTDQDVICGTTNQCIVTT